MARADKRKRPGRGTGAHENRWAASPSRSLRDRADLELRLAWLRVHAADMYGVDPTGQLSAELLDLVDLLEVAQREGWWAA